MNTARQILTSDVARSTLSRFGSRASTITEADTGYGVLRERADWVNTTPLPVGSALGRFGSRASTTMEGGHRKVFTPGTLYCHAGHPVATAAAALSRRFGSQNIA